MTSPPAEAAPHLTIRQLAERWQTTPQAIRLARHRGRAPKGFKRGAGRTSPVLFPLSEVEKFEAERMAEDRPSHRRTAAGARAPEPLRARPAKA
jgi:hypothetical protein